MSLRELDEAMAAGHVSDIRKILLKLDAQERELLKAEVGEHSYRQLYAITARGVRGPKRGRVILLHGIMGADLDVERAGDRDRVWVNYFRLFNGRIKDLRLNPDGTQHEPATTVVVRRQNKKYYLPPLLALDLHWEARAFAYDWRLDIRTSADRLAELVTTFGQGQPLHLVAHSMGGLVSRSFIARHPQLWARCDDANGHERGGRLIMLGTPNHGSYSIPLAFTGEESKIKALALIDRKHSKARLLGIVNSFPGSYQMLPSPFEDSSDDREPLYRGATWGRFPVLAEHLADARRFHESLRPAIDPERFIYIAGTDQETPAAIDVSNAGKFRYQSTWAGDGRVTHALGRLRDVRTYYVREAHSDLPRDDRVLGAIHDLLQHGETRELETEATIRRGASIDFKEPAEAIPAELKQLVAADAGRGPRDETRLSTREQRRVESLLLDDRARASVGSTAAPAQTTPSARPPHYRSSASLNIEVVWGDITRVHANVYAVGHYTGVLPQYAERALDAALSGSTDPALHVLRQHALRGQLHGALGDIDLFPWRGGASGRCVAVVGMGAPGTFTAQSLRLATRKLVWAVSSLPQAKTVASVLIGSGEGTLTIREALGAYLDGVREALDDDDMAERAFTLRLVELYRDRADLILSILRDMRKEGAFKRTPALRIRGKMRIDDGGRLRDLDAFRHVARVVVADRSNGTAAKHFKGLIASVKRTDAAIAGPLEEALKGFLARAAQSPIEQDSSDPDNPIRMSFSLDEGGIRVAAISSSTTVSERILRFDRSLLEELIEQVDETEDTGVERFADLLTRLLLPGVFRDWIANNSGPFVFDVDRAMARVHWEMLESDFHGERDNVPLAVRAVVSRQLRTSYAAPPLRPPPAPGRLRVLIVGDPGDPDTGDSLPGAHDEALAVWRFLSAHADIEVKLLIGSPNAPRVDAEQNFEPAGRMEFMREILSGSYDILHYCGHGDFDPLDGERAGWVFSGGLITSREIELVEAPPPLVIANACLSARTTQAHGARAARRLETKLLPSLADEFFRRGVRNYVGTAWTVSDAGAVLFAQTFYRELLNPRGCRLGEAVRLARFALYEQRQDYGGLWSAYQHYGDPNSVVRRRP